MKQKKQTFLDGFFFEKQEVTDEVVAYYRKNPKELDLIVDQEEYHLKFLWYFFIIGLVITMGSRILKYFFAGDWGEFVNDVILDVLSELGIAIFGGAVTAFLLEFLQKKQYERNVRYRNEIKARLEQEK